MSPVTEIGSFGAKAKLSELLREVKQGHCYTITLRSHPIADLIPSTSVAHQDAYTAIESMQNAGGRLFTEV